jgi:hypothetical protein
MKKLALFLLVPSFVWAQGSTTVEKPVVCNWTSVVLDTLREKYQEEPVWLGKDAKSQYTLFVNQKTGAFTIVQFNNEIACILGAGESSINLPNKSNI